MNGTDTSRGYPLRCSTWPWATSAAIRTTASSASPTPTRPAARPTPIWYVGDGNPLTFPSNVPTVTYGSGGSKEFPVRSTTTVNGIPIPDVGNIKIAASGTTIYAAVTWATNGLLRGRRQHPEVHHEEHRRRPDLDGPATALANYLGTQGWYDSTIVVSADEPEHRLRRRRRLPGHAQQQSWSTRRRRGHLDGHLGRQHRQRPAHRRPRHGLRSPGPADRRQRRRRLAPTTRPANAWTDINGNLAITTLQRHRHDPTNPNIILGGSQDNGTELVHRQPGCGRTIDDGDGGLVPLRPEQPRHRLPRRQRPACRSPPTAARPGPPSSTSARACTSRSLVDPVNSAAARRRQRLGAQSSRSRSTAGRPGRRPERANLPSARSPVAAVRRPTRGPSSPTRASRGRRQGGQHLRPQHHLRHRRLPGLRHQGPRPDWVEPLPGRLGFGGIAISDLDGRSAQPRHRLRRRQRRPERRPGRVFKTTDAGQTWTDITGDLPDVPVWKLVIDPRTGTLYVGTDHGVCSLPQRTANRQLAAVRRRHARRPGDDLDLNVNTEHADGRHLRPQRLPDSTWTTSRPTPAPSASTSGSSTWTGPVVFDRADHRSRRDGNQALPNGPPPPRSRSPGPSAT